MWLFVKIPDTVILFAITVHQVMQDQIQWLYLMDRQGNATDRKILVNTLKAKLIQWTWDDWE